MAIRFSKTIIDMKKQCWVIAGGCSAIAVQFAHEVAMCGDQLILLGRNLENLNFIKKDLEIRYDVDVHVLYFDAEKKEDHATIAKRCIEIAEYPISLLLAFGLMLPDPAIHHSVIDVIKVIDTNLTAVASFTFSFVPYFKEKNEGHILVLGSVAGDRGRPFNFDYGSAKAGLIPFCEGLNASLSQYNVTVTLMKLGYIDTPMSYGKPRTFLAASARDCAYASLAAVKSGKKLKYYPWFWYWIMLAFKMIPSFFLRKMKM